MTTETMRLLIRARELVQRAERQSTADYPVGSRVSYQHGKNIRTGEVVMHGAGPRVKIRYSSGKWEWIHVERLLP